MKLKLTLLLLVVFTLSLTAQRLRDKKIGYHYITLPVKKMPADYQTYSVRVSGSAIEQAGRNIASLQKGIKLEGFKRLSGSGEDYGHLRIKIYTGYVSTGKVERKKNTTTTKDKKTEKTTTKTTYSYVVPYSGSGFYKVYDPNGNILLEERVPFSYSKNTSSYSSGSAAYDSYKNNRAKWKIEAAKALVGQVYDKTRKGVYNQFGFTANRKFLNTYYLKKHDKEDEFKKYFELTKATFEKFEKKHDEALVEEVKGIMAPALEFWRAEGNFDPKGEKKSKRVHKAANMNVAIVSYYLGDLNAAKEYADMVNKADEGKDYDAKWLLKEITNTQKRMSTHGITSMHHKRDLSNAKRPAEVKALEKEKEELAKNNDATEATLVFGGEELKGAFMLAKDAEDMVFGDKGNVKFVVEEEGVMKEYDLTSDEVSSFQLGDRKFLKMSYRKGANAGGEDQKAIMEELYSSDKMKVLKYYSSAGVLSNDKSEFAFMKTGDTAPTSLESTSFLLWKKGAAKYFGDCPDLSTLCKEGGIEKTQESLVKAARIYSEVCE